MSGIDRVEERLRDEVYEKPSLLDASMLEVFSESYIYLLAAASLTNMQYPTHHHRAIYYREKRQDDFEKAMKHYIGTHRYRAERELRQMDADNAADARADAMQEEA